MNFEFTEEQLMIQQAARDYAQRELIKDVIERDTKAEFPTGTLLKNLVELGFMGMMTDPKYDGGGMDTVSYVLAMELSKVDASASVIVSVNNSLVCYG